MKTDIYTLAHEMKNPLCVANGYLEMMNENNFLKYREIVKKEINDSLEILNSYLEINKIMVQKEEIDLNVLLEDINNSMKSFLNANNINLIVKIVKDDVYLKADYNKIKQVLYNIIKNSMEWQSKNITISYKILKNKIKIFVENDGDNILNEDLSNIGNFSHNVLGNGIGLKLSKEIIKQHGGTYKVINNSSQGISTIITLLKE